MLNGGWGSAGDRMPPSTGGGKLALLQGVKERDGGCSGMAELPAGVPGAAATLQEERMGNKLRCWKG